MTTAIFYTNGNPHIGHAYEVITSDIAVRYHRIFGRDTYFLTGTDEHGQKVCYSNQLFCKSVSSTRHPLSFFFFFVFTILGQHKRQKKKQRNFVRIFQNFPEFSDFPLFFN